MKPSNPKVKPNKSATTAEQHIKPRLNNASSIGKKKLKRKNSMPKIEKTPIYALPDIRVNPLKNQSSKSSNKGKETILDTAAAKNLTNILDTLKREYDKIERKKLGNSVTKEREKPLEHSWAERSQSVREKLDEIMKKHSQTLKNLSKLYKVPLDSNSNSYSSAKEAILNTKWPLMTTPSKIRASVITSTEPQRTRNSSISTVANVQPKQSKDVARKTSTSTSRYNTTAIANVTGMMKYGGSKSSTSKLILNQPYMLRDEIKLLREKVDQAIKYKRTFTICGNYYSIRNALLTRGWVEKMHPNYVPPHFDINLFRRLQTLTIPELSIGLKDKELGPVYRSIIMSKMVGSMQVAFYWDLSRDTYRNNVENLKDSLINFINKNRFNYANKQGLCESAKTAYWYHYPGVSFLRTPRAYCLVNTGDPDEFIQDFKLTAAKSFLKWIIHTHENNVSKLISDSGKVPLSFFHFALRQCANYARKLKHEDIDKEIPVSPDKEWQTFLDYFYKAVHVGNHFKQSGLESEMSLVHKSRTMLKKLGELDPYLDMDGYMNIWILKPAYGSRGLGIHFCRTLQYVLKVIKENKNNSYVIQKYIERPLLIYNTKFDIRQWFLISSTQPITIWIYKECYLRFSSQTYNLRKLHESIHLTNNSVQSKYHNGNRDMCLPLHNMWYLSEFKNYLNNIGYPNVFEQTIFPGMRECIVAAILTNQDQIFRTSKAFELHGADFMITEDFKPWLIEINSKPALNPSTVVTSKLCPMVLEDVIKVVIDNARNPRAPTGNFIMVYKEKILSLPSIQPDALRLEGKPITNDYFLSPEDAKETLAQQVESNDSLNVITTADYMKYVGNEMKKTLRQLLSIIEKERARRKALKDKTTPAVSPDDSFIYCQDMQKIQSNMEEIEEIFKQDIADSNESTTSVTISEISKEPNKSRVNFKRASDLTLTSSSRIISSALTSLNRRADSQTVKEVIKMVSKIQVPTGSPKNGREKLADIMEHKNKNTVLPKSPIDKRRIKT